MCSCTSSNPADAIGNALFAEPLLCIPSTSDRVQSGPVLVRDVDFASTCANSLLPFYGRAHAAYAPGAGVVVGLSKVARLVHHLSKRITTPRELARDAAAVLQRESGALGAVVVLSFRRLGTFDGSPAREEVVVERTGCFPGPHSPAWAEFRCMLALAGVSLPEEQPFADGINAGKSSERSSVSSDTMPIESG